MAFVHESVIQRLRHQLVEKKAIDAKKKVAEGLKLVIEASQDLPYQAKMDIMSSIFTIEEALHPPNDV